MLRSIGASTTRPRPTVFDRMWRCSRSLRVEVLDWGRVADSFQISDPKILGAAVAPIYKHLPEEGVAVRMVGIEERSLPLGQAWTMRQIPLCDLSEARGFLDG